MQEAAGSRQQAGRRQDEDAHACVHIVSINSSRHMIIGSRFEFFSGLNPLLLSPVRQYHV